MVRFEKEKEGEEESKELTNFRKLHEYEQTVQVSQKQWRFGQQLFTDAVRTGDHRLALHEQGRLTALEGGLELLHISDHIEALSFFLFFFIFLKKYEALSFFVFPFSFFFIFFPDE